MHYRKYTAVLRSHAGGNITRGTKYRSNLSIVRAIRSAYWLLRRTHGATTPDKHIAVPKTHSATYTLHHPTTSPSPHKPIYISLHVVDCISTKQTLRKRVVCSPLNDRSLDFTDSRPVASQPTTATAVQMSTSAPEEFYNDMCAVRREPLFLGRHSRTGSLLQCPGKPTCMVHYHTTAKGAALFQCTRH